MRCLYCNKKLSLLKLAKGDSFCSPQHFDAYQLQLSKNAYERLASVPEGDAPKAPLVFTPVEAPPSELEVDSALARLSAHDAPELAGQVEAFEAPPFAPFLVSPLPSFPPDGRVAVADEPDANEPVGATPGLVLPVHDVPATVCILNLYLRVGLSDTPPRDWTAGPYAVAAPESFPVEITRPRLEVRPDGEFDAPAEVPEPAAQVLPVTPPSVTGPEETPGHRVPFIAAPSFRERAGAEIPFDAAASSAPREWMPAPVLHPAKLPGTGWSGRISQSTGFAGNTLQPADAAAVSIQSGSGMKAWVKPLVPRDGAIKRYRWRAESGPAGIARPSAETRRTPTRAMSFNPPAPAAVLPNAALAPDIDRDRILTATGSAGSLFQWVLETRPQGQDQVFLTASVDVMDYGLQAVVATTPAWGPVSSGTWQNQTAPFPLSVPIADVVELTRFRPQPLAYAPDCIKQDAGDEQAPSIEQLAHLPFAWPVADAFLPPPEGPAPADALPVIHFLAPARVSDHPALMASALLGTPCEPVFAAAASKDFGRPDFRIIASKRLPAAARAVFQSKIGLCDLAAVWNPSGPATPAVPVVKFLPARRSAILPSARSWPRLGAPSL